MRYAVSVFSTSLMSGCANLRGVGSSGALSRQYNDPIMVREARASSESAAGIPSGASCCSISAVRSRLPSVASGIDAMKAQ